MKILKLEIAGYRSLKKQVWEPGDLNVVIGPNGSGKSNLLDTLELLAQCARGGLGKYIQRAGGMEPLVWDGAAQSIFLDAVMAPGHEIDDGVSDALRYQLALGRLGNTSGYRVDREVLGQDKHFDEPSPGSPKLFLVRGPLEAVVYSIENGATRVHPPRAVSDEEPLLASVSSPFAPNPVAAQFRDELASWAIYQGFHTDPESAVRRATVARLETRVQEDGQNLIAVLHTLYTGNRDFEEEVNVAMRSAFGDDFDRLVFPPAADQRIQLRVRWKSLRREQSAADLSDGTLRFLYLLTILANPDPPALLAIDEPETGLHPSMLPIVAEYARDAAMRTQVILTTHSPELLDAFGKEPLTTTVLEWRDGQSTLRVLSGEQLKYWLRKYTLGELYRSKELETMA